MISINDLKGFDFSKKYVDIAEELNLKYKGNNFTITPELNEHGEINGLKCTYKINNEENWSTQSISNPFSIIKRINTNILETESTLEYRVKLLEELLCEYAPEKTNWYDLKSKLSESYSNLIDYYPNYQSEIFPNNLNKEDLNYYFISKFYPNVDRKTYNEEEELDYLYSNEGATKLKNFLNTITALDYAILLKNDIEGWIISQLVSLNQFELSDNELSGADLLNTENFFSMLSNHKPLYLRDYNSIKNSRSRLNYECQDLYFDAILKMFEINIPNKEIKKDIYDIVFEKKNPNHPIEVLKEKLTSLTINSFYISMLREQPDNDCHSIGGDYDYFKHVDGDFTFDLNDLYLKKIYYSYLESINKKRSYISHFLFDKENTIIDETIFDSQTIQQEAIKNNHIIEGHGKGVLRFAKIVPEIKDIIIKYDLKISGRKDELINRIESHLTEEEINKEFPGNVYILTQEGIDFYNKYSKTFKYAVFIPDSFYFDEFIEICDKNPDYTPEDILFVLMKEKWITCSKPLSDFAKDNFSIVNTSTTRIEYVFRKIRPDLVDELLKSESRKKLSEY